MQVFEQSECEQLIWTPVQLVASHKAQYSRLAVNSYEQITVKFWRNYWMRSPSSEPRLTIIFVPPDASERRVDVSHECSICSQDTQQPTKHTQDSSNNGSWIADAQQGCLNVTTSTKNDIYH